MVSRLSKLVGILLAASALIAAGAQAVPTGPPPPPTATNGHPVIQVASGLGTPTSFAFGAGSVFEGDGGNSMKGPPNGGVFVLAGGKGTKIAGSPQFVGGLAWHKGALYVSGGFVTGPKSAKWQLLKWSGWNGTKFAKRTVIYTAPKRFDGFNGVAFGPDGRLYVGVDLGLTDNNDHGPAKTPYVYDIVSIKPNGKDFKVFASGIRQPWQIAFAPGSGSPYVSDLGQDTGAKNAPDFLLRVHAGQNYGFPQCNQTLKSKCRGFAKPYKFLSPHTDPGDLGIMGGRLYMSEFGFTPVHPPLVVSMPLGGGPLTPLVKGFVAPVVGLGTHAGYVYFGELTGQVFRVRP